MRGAALTWVLAVLALAASGCSRAPENRSTEPASSEDEPHAQEEINLDLWLERLEVGSRELYSARENVVGAIGISAGDTVADIGAGTGLYSLLFAEAVGPEGRVFAEDIEPLFLDLINRRAEDAGVNNITAVYGRETDVTLPDRVVDFVFIADTYHYFDDREAVMTSILRALKPGGSLIIVDYDLEPGAEKPSEKSHVRFGKAGVISEIEFVGFEFVEEPDVEGLEENYMIRFEKPAS
ncbi:class I SAM-dependent methyltransferase [Hyphococcus sp.]|uniref:class I SAM-dependent methyltransferase n=1 Tax=Hyphococcus sp. TaxID=2038636 RepID=UPI003CCC4382